MSAWYFLPYRGHIHMLWTNHRQGCQARKNTGLKEGRSKSAFKKQSKCSLRFPIKIILSLHYDSTQRAQTTPSHLFSVEDQTYGKREPESIVFKWAEGHAQRLQMFTHALTLHKSLHRQGLMARFRDYCAAFLQGLKSTPRKLFKMFKLCTM